MKHKIEADHSKFWLGKNFDTAKIDVESVMDLVRLASYRRAISNFVFILTGKDIPVRFAEKAKSKTNGKIVYIGGELIKGEFDSTVGLALHEAMHIVKSDFGLLSSWAKIPSTTIAAAKSRISVKELGEFVRYIYNVVEDRYIDAWAIRDAPGYRGYYRALYDRYFNQPDIDDALQSDNYRSPTLKNYRFRFTNIVNKNSDLDALPGLRYSYELLDLPNILRIELDSPQDRLELAFQIVESFVENLIKELEEKENERTKADGEQSGQGDSEETSEETDKENESQGVDDVPNPKVEEAIKEQEAFVERTNSGTVFTGDVIKKLTVLENSGIELVKVGNEEGVPETECVVVTNLSRELIDTGDFPFSSKIRSASENPEAARGVRDGIVLGTMLGRRLQVRGEVKVTKFTRLQKGKIDKRLLPAIGYGSENLFYQTSVDKYKFAHLHVSVDGSSSMAINWRKTMTMLVAIAKAASMINNISVSISFRTGTILGKHGNFINEQTPYVVLAYDSRIDKFQKIVQLFPLLFAHGSTPEGLAFQGILKHIPVSTYELDSYFVNLSDGEPAFGTVYNGDKAARHTRKQVGKIRDKGVEVLSYFVADDAGTFTNKSDRVTGNAAIFKSMYGKDAQFIDVENVTQIAHTMNKKFLAREK